MAHNGEINTVKGNKNWQRSRHTSFSYETIGVAKGEDGFLNVSEGLSDSGVFDTVLNTLTASGRDIPECMMLMVPESWQENENMLQEKRDFYEYVSFLLC